MSRIGFIGLGVMGYPMAGHLARAGHSMTVYNRSPASADRWLAAFPGTRASTPAAAAGQAEFVITCVSRDADLREVTLGAEGAFTTLQSGAVFIDHSTTSAEVAREIATVGALQGIAVLDAPVSGGQAGAEKGSLTCMLGGEPAAFALAAPVIAAYTGTARLLGSAGAGQLCKMVNQTCIAGLLQGLSEGLAFCLKAGLDPAEVLSVISKGAAQSWQMDNRAATMCDGRFDFGFAVDLMRKDLGIVLDEARRNGARLPVTALVDQHYAELQARNMGRADTSSLIELLK